MLDRLLPSLLDAGLLTEDPVPAEKDVVAGPWGALVVVALLAAATFLAFSFLKQLRKAQAAKDAGVYGDPPVTDTADDAGDAEEPGEDRDRRDDLPPGIEAL